jgi:flagellar hook assembly protein FlgD
MGSMGEAKAYPNPFRENITLEYQLQQDGRVEIQINNILGQKIKSLIKNDQQAGLHRIKWDGMDESGSLVPTGMYYITLRTPTDKKVIKVMKTK